MATQQEVQLFDALLDQGLDQEKAKSTVLRARERGVITDALSGLGIKAERIEEVEVPEVPEVPEFIKEEAIVTERIQTEEPEITPEIAGSKARQELAERDIVEIEAEREAAPGFLAKRLESLKEEITEEGLVGRGFKRAEASSESFKKGDIIKGIVQLEEAGLQIAGGTIFELFDQALAIAGAVTLKPLLASLDADTLAQVNAIASKPIEFVGDVATSDTGQAIGDFFDKIPQNIKDDILAGLAFLGVKLTKKTGKVLKREAALAKEQIKKLPGTKVARIEKLRVADKIVKDNVELLSAGGKKIKEIDKIDFGKLVADNHAQLRFAKDFDDLAIRVGNIGIRDINILNKSLAGVKKTFKPKGAKEVLKEMKKNADKINFNTADKKIINDFLKKINTEGLTLTELNTIKKSINKYNRAWTKSGLEGAGLKSESIRNKYSEVAKFIENTATRQGIPNVKELNRGWAVSEQFSNLLIDQARRAGSKEVLKQITQPGAIKRMAEGIQRLLPTGPGLTQDTTITGIQKNIEKLLDNILDASKQTGKLKTPGLLEQLGKKKS